MNIKILLLVLATFGVATTLSQQVLKIRNYQYPSSCMVPPSLISKQSLGKGGMNFGQSSISDDCNSNQLYGGNYVSLNNYSIVDINNIDPWYSLAALSIRYGSGCNGDWKDQFIQSNYVLINQCINFDADSSLLVTCNSTTISEAVSTTSNTCDDTETTEYTIGTLCNDETNKINILSLCNLS